MEKSEVGRLNWLQRGKSRVEPGFTGRYLPLKLFSCWWWWSLIPPLLATTPSPSLPHHTPPYQIRIHPSPSSHPPSSSSESSRVESSRVVTSNKVSCSRPPLATSPGSAVPKPQLWSTCRCSNTTHLTRPSIARKPQIQHFRGDRQEAVSKASFGRRQTGSRGGRWMTRVV
ncbi:hypothetical protein BJ508DRAFT_110585 [Ascobolus immersus RN42]|uniref:Uncharacterized protein n=1 Tax=Ascobolus immersus RN42 TaxID=1160509 RepID=A0A3N4HCP8_ASCIM|nr:hypothetical protein BJ508DRAFT_110585 [Ascobolus immersus RN42]